MSADERKVMAQVIEIAEQQNKMFSLVRQRFERLEDRITALEDRIAVLKGAGTGGQDAAAQKCTE